MSKKKYNLVGVDGNAFCVMGYVANAMEESGFTEEEIKQYHESAMSSDYNNLLCVSIAMVEECNKRSK